MLERSHLKLLLALDECGSLTAAADSLNLTQSALSHAIRKLEHALGSAIWEKSGRKLRLTQAGEFLLELARQLEPRFVEAEQVMQGFSEGKKGKLRIGMECHPCYEWLMSIVPAYLVKWPDVDLDVIQRFRFDGLNALVLHHIDVLITSDPLQREDLINIPVMDYELLLITRVKQGSPHKPPPLYIKPKALTDQFLFTFPVEKARLDVFTHFLLPAHVEPLKHQHIETIEVMLQLVANGRGVCTLPDWLLKKYQSSFNIHGVRLGKEGIRKRLFLVMRKGDVDRAYLKEFIDVASR